MKKSFIELYADNFTVKQSNKQGEKVSPESGKFFKPEAGASLFRDWQVNPIEFCWIINGNFQIERIMVEPMFRIFYQNYRGFNTYNTEADALQERDLQLEFREMRQYKLYGKTSQLDLFEDRIQLLK